MAAPPREPRQPKYRLHKASGRAIVTLNYPDGRRQDVLLGIHGSPESHVRYHQVIAEWAAHKRLPPRSDVQSAQITIGELIVRFWDGHVTTYYRDAAGAPTSEQENFRQVLRSLKSLFQDREAEAFEPSDLKVWQHAVTRPLREVIDPGTGKPRQVKGWSRTNANKHLSRIKQLFKWAVPEKLVSIGVYQSLLTVPGLRFGRSDARETDPVRPVPEEFVAAIDKLVAPEVAALARLQIYSCARPGELCDMRWADIETGGVVWLYRPSQHKNAYRGHVREIPLGPECQKVLNRFKKLDLNARIFAPYTVTSYRRAIARACQKEPPDHLKRIKVASTKRKNFQRWETAAEHEKRIGPAAWRELLEWRKSHHWHPHRARHTAGTRVRKQHGLQGAQVMLGHKHAKVTEIYAETNSEFAMRIAAEMG